jgi:hypothetical protein
MDDVGGDQTGLDGLIHFTDGGQNVQGLLRQTDATQGLVHGIGVGVACAVQHRSQRRHEHTVVTRLDGLSGQLVALARILLWQADGHVGHQCVQGRQALEQLWKVCKQMRLDCAVAGDHGQPASLGSVGTCNDHLECLAIPATGIMPLRCIRIW